MKKKTGILACLLLSLCLAACGKGKEVEMNEPYVFYVDAKGMSLVKQNYECKNETLDEEIKELLTVLREPEESVEYESAIPKEVEVVDYKVNESKLDLYFNDAYNKMGKAEEVLCRASVVQSMVQIPGVDYVSFYVDGVMLTNKAGVPLGYMREEDFVQNIGPALNSYQKATLKLFYSDSKGEKLKEETVNIRYNSNILIEKLVLEQLMKGSSINGSKSAIPKDTKLLGVSVRDHICYVNFDEGFLASGYEGDPRITIYSIVNSLIESSTVNQVQISVNGETDISFQGAVDLGKPLMEDLSMMEEIK